MPNKYTAVVWQDISAVYAEAALRTLLDLPLQATLFDRESAMRRAVRWQNEAGKYARGARLIMDIRG